MRILVTGGAGFIGSHLTDALIKKGHQLAVFDNFSAGNKKFVNPRARLRRISSHDYDQAAKLFRVFRPQAVFHLAAQIDARAVFADKGRYATDSMNLWLLAREHGVSHFIFSSSAAVYGGKQNLPLSERFAGQPVSDYGFSKHGFELHLASKYRSDKMKAVSLRYANVYGPRQGTVGEGGVVAVFCKRLLSRKPLLIFGSGSQTRDFIFVSDVVESNLKALRCQKLWAIYNVSTQKETTVNALAKKLLQISGIDVPIIRKSAVKGEVKRSALSNNKIKRELGWRPAVSLDEGLAHTWRWFRERY